MKTSKTLGIDKYESVIEAEIQENGVIWGFNAYTLIQPDQSYDQNRYLAMNAWMHSVEINGRTLNSGETLPQDWNSNIDPDTQEEIDSAYRAEGLYCTECGMFHDLEQYYNVSYRVVDCSVFCNECVNVDDLITKINEPGDVFKVDSIEGLGEPECYEEVETLFCDSSGFGSSYEPALTKTQLETKISEMLEEFSEPLFAAVTGVGQFQVYITIYKERAV